MGATRWGRVADRCGRYGWVVPVIAVGLALVGSVIDAFAWQPGPESTQVVDECEPPHVSEVEVCPACTISPRYPYRRLRRRVVTRST